MADALVFELVNHYGRNRYYPMNVAAKAILEVAGRKVLHADECLTLRQAGFTVDVRVSDGIGS